MERVPFAMRAMSKAAVDAGLIDGSKTEQERERALFKLMEQGQLISGDILPHFGKAMSELANNNDELAKALSGNLSPALGRASNNLVELQKQLFDGMKPSVMFALDGFSDLSKESGNLAYFIGKVLGGALLTVTALVRLPIAAFIDLTYWLSETLGLGDEFTQTILGMTGTIIGGSLAIWGMVKAVKALRGAYRMFKGAKAAAGELLGTGSKVGASGATKGAGSAIGKGLLRQGAGTIGRAAGPLALIAGTGDALYSLYERLMSTNERNAAVLKAVQEGKLKIDINLNPNGLDDAIDAKVEKSNGNMITDAYMNILSGSER